jgi:hypothetical protein
MDTGLAAAIDELLDVDPAGLSDDELQELVVATHRQSHRLAAARARLVAVWDARRCWASDGSRSPGHRLAREASMSVRAAKHEVRRATALRSMPHTAAALADGALSPEHVDLLAGANNGNRRALFEPHEEMLVAQCKVLRFADAYRMIEYWKQHADAEATEDDAQRQHDGRGATAATTIDGMVDVRALLDPIGGAAFLDELVRLMEQLRLDDERTGRMRTATQRRADALVEMATRSRTAREGGLRPRPLLTILVGEESFARVCELASGTVVAPGQIVPLLSDADVERIVFDGPDRVVSVSHKRRFSGALRRAIEVRDRHCQHPSGCDEPASRCDVDHIVPHSEGGMTSQDNGELRCWPHNRIPEVRNARPRDPPTNESPNTILTSDPDAPLHPDDRAPPNAA